MRTWSDRPALCGRVAPEFLGSICFLLLGRGVDLFVGTLLVVKNADYEEAVQTMSCGRTRLFVTFFVWQRLDAGSFTALLTV